MNAIVNSSIALARSYRNETGRHHGVVVIFDGVVSGWSNVLRDPQNWRPGCIAITDSDTCYCAMGGNDDDGAIEWRPF